MTATVEQDPATIPGAMEVTRERELTDGTRIRYEEAPRGYLTKAGKPRQSDWRAYHHVPTEGKPRRLPSVSTITGTLCPPQLAWWGEEHGVLGAVEAVRRGEIDPADPASAERAVETVRALRLGQDAARDRAADRGLNVHAILETYARTGSVPNPADHPPEHGGFLQGLIRWTLHADPEPVAVEQLVCSTESPVAYAGRLDLVARIGGQTVLVDLKSNPRGAIYSGAHVQAAAYARGLRECGDPYPERIMIVVVDQDGSFREMECCVGEPMLDAALAWYALYAPLDAACMGQNRAEAAARKAT